MDERGIISRSKIRALKAAIQEKTGTSGGMTIDQMTEAVRNMSTGGKPFQVPITWGVGGSYWSVTGGVTASDIFEHKDNIELVAPGVIYHSMGCTYTDGYAQLVFGCGFPSGKAFYAAFFKLTVNVDENKVTVVDSHLTFNAV